MLTLAVFSSRLTIRYGFFTAVVSFQKGCFWRIDSNEPTPTAAPTFHYCRDTLETCIDPLTQRKTSESRDCPRRRGQEKCKLYLKGTANGQLIKLPLNTRNLVRAVAEVNEKLT